MTADLFYQICEYLDQLTAGTTFEGHVFAVGGCCRDVIMGVEINDIDLAVDLPDGGIRLARWLYESKKTVAEPVYYPMFGTAMLHLSEFPDDEIEIVQTRREKYLPGSGGNPETAFGTLEEDCFRRDLTINSLYYDIKKREFIDFTGKGIHDIHQKVLQTPDDPDKTFDDDPVRILRCLRFASRFNWSITTETYNSLKKNVKNLNKVTRSRMRGELNKMLLSQDPVRALKKLRYTGALSEIIPEISPTFRLKLVAGDKKTAWDETLEMVEASVGSLEERWAALLKNIGKYRVRSVKRNGTIVFNNYEAASARTARLILNRLRYDRDFIQAVDAIIKGKTQGL